MKFEEVFMEQSAAQSNDHFLLIPANGGGAIVHKSQIVGARPNGNEGAIVYTQAGPSIYTTLSTKSLAEALSARPL